jgi:hypothetical protein
VLYSSSLITDLNNTLHLSLEYLSHGCISDDEIQELCVREFSCHELNANLLWPVTFSFATWLAKNQSVLDGQRILELGRYGDLVLQREKLSVHSRAFRDQFSKCFVPIFYD